MSFFYPSLTVVWTKFISGSYIVTMKINLKLKVSGSVLDFLSYYFLQFFGDGGRKEPIIFTEWYH